MPPPIHEFRVNDTPVTVNRYGTRAYRIWRQLVYRMSIAAAPSGVPIVNPCMVKVRYFHHQDLKKDVDNILKPILDGLQGLAGGRRVLPRILDDDHLVAQVVSRRTDLVFGTKVRANAFRREEFLAMMDALAGDAAVYVRVDSPPDDRTRI
ncbi:RusA family crossover junction endodeoxyribonuclease [Azospirillum brasilense]|nr:RusA family crossover junction endodeoxyribonuclease [Azospirillum brasilense]